MCSLRSLRPRRCPSSYFCLLPFVFFFFSLSSQKAPDLYAALVPALAATSGDCVCVCVCVCVWPESFLRPVLRRLQAGFHHKASCRREKAKLKAECVRVKFISSQTRLIFWIKGFSQKWPTESTEVAELRLPCAALLLTPLWDTYGCRDIPEQRRSCVETTSNTVCNN